MVEEKKISIFDLIIILLKKKWLLFIVTILFTGFGFFISSIMTKYYTATATILQPKKKIADGLGSLLSELPMGGMLKNMDFLGQNDIDQFLNILQSRRLADKTILRFDLINRYNFGKKKKFYYENVIKLFHKNVTILENKYDNIEISYTDSNPEFAATVTNYIITQLDTINYLLAKESAKNSRQFFGERLNLIKTDLDSASQRFAQFQIDHNYIDLEQQVKSSIEAVSQVEAQKMSVDLEIEQIKNQFGDNSQRMVELVKNKKTIENTLAHAMKDENKGILVPLKNAPELSIRYGFLYRDVKTQAALYQFVLQMFEQAKFSEANNSPTVQVLEWAIPPQMKTRPKRAVFMILFFFIGISAGCVSILLKNWYQIQKSKQSEIYLQINQIVSLLFSFKTR